MRKRSDSLIRERVNFVVSNKYKYQHLHTYMTGLLPMSPLLATLSIWASTTMVSFSGCLMGCWRVERWSGSGCCRWPLPALLLGNGRVDIAVGGWVSVLWGKWDVLTALGGSGSLPITDPEPDAARKKSHLLLLVVKIILASLFLSLKMYRYPIL